MMHSSILHVTYSCICILSFLSICDVFPLSLSLSLSRIDYTWHPSANPLWLGTLLVPGFLLLIHPLFTFSSVIGRPNRTSLRTFRNVVFIQSAMSFHWTFPTFLYLVSFGLRDRNLFVRYPWGSLSCLYRSFTLIYTVLIPLYLSLPRHSEVRAS